MKAYSVYTNDRQGIRRVGSYHTWNVAQEVADTARDRRENYDDATFVEAVVLPDNYVTCCHCGSICPPNIELDFEHVCRNCYEVAA